MPAPSGLEDTLPASADPAALTGAARALAVLLRPLTAELDVDGVAEVAAGRLAGRTGRSAE
ncbi:hypothetical protein [Amycolatopsis antarctica]|nr:hypothetical protein [Amycolatopsis antarctica]